MYTCVSGVSVLWLRRTLLCHLGAAHRAKAKETPVFYEIADEPCTPEAHAVAWSGLQTVVENKLGRILFASLTGSRRYNLSVSGSDYDYFVVYQASTSDVLSLSAPVSIVKNKPGAKPDFTGGQRPPPCRGAGHDLVRTLCSYGSVDILEAHRGWVEQMCGVSVVAPVGCTRVDACLGSAVPGVPPRCHHQAACHLLHPRRLRQAWVGQVGQVHWVGSCQQSSPREEVVRVPMSHLQHVAGTRSVRVSHVLLVQVHRGTPACVRRQRSRRRGAPTVD